MLPDHIVRKRRCVSCGHQWFTVEVIVPDYAVGWSKLHRSKPVLRVPVELTVGHTKLGTAAAVEAQDQLAPLREANKRRSAKADQRHAL